MSNPADEAHIVDDWWDQDDEEEDQEDDFDVGEAPSYTRIERELVPLSDEGRLATVGESYYQRALRLIAEGKKFGHEFSEHGPVDVVLVPEPENPHDPNAVRVDVLVGAESLKVSYLAREVAQEYQPELLGLARRGCLGTCPGRLTGGGPGRSYGIYLHLAPPESIFAPPPIGAAASFARILDFEILLKPEWHCEVTGEEAHQDVLRPYSLVDDVSEVRATLGFCTIAKGKYRGERAIEVSVAGKRVGQLTYAMTQRYGEIVDAVQAQGKAAVCFGYVVASRDRGLQVHLRMPRDPARRAETSWF